MTVIVERDLQITLPAGVTARRFDDGILHGLSHCMKAVDFIVDLPDRVVFIEFKDPQDASAPEQRGRDYLAKFSSGAIDEQLKTKFRDTFLYEWASGRVNQPIDYWVLIGADMLSPAELLTRTEALKRHVPAQGPLGRPWKNKLVRHCAVMNLASWNRQLPQFPAKRLSA